MPTFGMSTGSFEGGVMGVLGGGSGGGAVLDLSQYRKNRLTAVIPTTSTPMATDCADHLSDVCSPSLDV